MVEIPKQPVDHTLSPKDGMHVAGQEAHYFAVGYSAIRNIQAGLLAAGLKAPTTILDMACGYGRVLRMLKAYFPTAHLTACDINTVAVDFCAETFGASKAYADENFERMNLSETFDLIWCGSLLTHLDRSYWKSFMIFCAKHLADDGLLVFTTHGRYVATMITDYDFWYGLEPSQAHQIVNDYSEHGFGYCNYPARSTYGISIASPSGVFSFIEKQTDLQLCSVNEMGWDHHQDVYACCATQALAMQAIEAYAEKVINYVMMEIGGTNIPMTLTSADASPSKQKIVEWVETKITRDNMPFGPRVRRIVATITLDHLAQTFSPPPGSS